MRNYFLVRLYKNNKGTVTNFKKVFVQDDEKYKQICCKAAKHTLCIPALIISLQSEFVNYHFLDFILKKVYNKICIYSRTAGKIILLFHKESIYMNNEKNEHKSETEQALDEAELIEKTGGSVSDNAKHLIHCLTIIGQIEGHYVLGEQNKTTKYEHIIPSLVAVEQDRSVEGLMIILNTVGGDVEAGLAIAELIAGMKTPTVSLVVGGGHSIGVPLAVSAKHSFIVPSASMTIHPVRVSGTVLGVPQTLSYFDKMQDRIINFVTKNSSMSEEDYRRLLMNTEELVMDVGSVVDGEKAVELGLIDSLGGLSDAMQCLYDMIEQSGRRYSD